MRIETLRLAKELENGYLFPREQIVAELFRLNDLLGKANALARMRADELRRLHEVNQELVEALKNLCDQLPSNPIPLSTYFAKDELLAARAALAKAQGESNE